jgi:hypothetical protein
MPPPGVAICNTAEEVMVGAPYRRRTCGPVPWRGAGGAGACCWRRC